MMLTLAKQTTNFRVFRGTLSEGPALGEERHLLNGAAFLERFKGTQYEDWVQRDSTAPIPAHSSYEEKIGVGLGFRDFSATLIAVIYVDNTAQATDGHAIPLMISIRESNIRAIDKAIEIINSSATPQDAATALRKYAAVYQATPHSDPSLALQVGDLEGIAQDLEHLFLWDSPGTDSLKN